MNLKEHVLGLIVRDKLAEDVRTWGQTIDVFVADGSIYLVGLVDTEHQRSVAEELVRGLPGVRHVVDNIRIRQVRAASA